MTAWLRRIHQYLGLLVGIQLLLWTASGTVMSLLDADQVDGSLSRMPKPASPLWPHDVLPIGAVLDQQRTPVRTLETGWLLGKPVFRLSNSKGSTLVDAMTGSPVVIDAAAARALAVASYAGSGDPATPRLLARSGEVRKHKGPVWAVDFSDADETAVYVSAETGAIVAHRNNAWRLFDFFWMLHIMDYWDREDFNNPIVIGSGLGGLWLALSGIWLLVTSMRLAEFVPARFRSTHAFALFTQDGEQLRTAYGNAGDTVFVALSQAGVNLPSQCGGGQSCGLCVVKIRGSAPAPTSGDAAHISSEKLAAGYRLACNLALVADLRLELPNASVTGNAAYAVVQGVRDVTPSMREIVLRLEPGQQRVFWPGSYLQVQIPPYEVALERLGMTGESDLAPNATIMNVAGARRCYSLSRPAEQDTGTLTLLVRLMGGQQAGATQRFGVGSAYMFSLREGDRIQVAGPFGEFALREGAREKIFIGGGAGMAPLRAMIRQSLAAGDKEPIHFWYGARSLAETPYLDEMTALARDYSHFRWQLVISDEAVGTDGVLPGLVHLRARELFLEHHANLPSCDFYVCGPPMMLHATRQVLAEIGVSAGNISFDDFKI